MGTTSQNFYCEPTDQDDTWGTTVLKADPVSVTSNSATTLTFGTATTAQTRTVIPYAAAGVAGDDRINRGWAINQGTADGMQSVSGARRVIPAGQWRFSCTINVPTPGAVTGQISCQPVCNVYRVSAGPSYTRTLLFQIGATSQNVTALGGAQDLIFSTLSAAQPAITLEPGETIFFGIAVASTQTAGALGATVTNTQIYKTGSGTRLETPPPGIRTVYSSSTVVQGIAVAALSVKVGKVLAVAGIGIANFLRGISIRFPVTGAALAAVSKAVKPLPYVVTGIGLVTTAKKVYKPFLTTATGVASTVKRMFLAEPVTGAAVAAFTRALVATRQFTVTGTASAAFARAVIVARFFTVTGTGVTNLFLKIPQAALNRLAGGSTTIIKKIVNFVFDD